MPKDDQQTLEQFIAEMKADLERFEESYRRERAKNPEHWPDQMGGGDWYEQFLLFESQGDF